MPPKFNQKLPSDPTDPGLALAAQTAKPMPRGGMGLLSAGQNPESTWLPMAPGTQIDPGFQMPQMPPGWTPNFVPGGSTIPGIPAGGIPGNQVNYSPYPGVAGVPGNNVGVAAPIANALANPGNQGVAWGDIRQQGAQAAAAIAAGGYNFPAGAPAAGPYAAAPGAGATGDPRMQKAFSEAMNAIATGQHPLQQKVGGENNGN